jgi:predicted acetyltransferase
MENEYIWEVANKNASKKTKLEKQQEEIEGDIATKLHELWEIYNHNSGSISRFLRKKKSYWDIRLLVENCENNESLRMMLTMAIHTALDERY